MLFEFFLTHVLKRSLTLPLSFGLVYPAWNGTVVVRSSELTPPASEEITARIEIPYAKFDPQWSSLRRDVIVVDSAYFRDVAATIDVARPAETIYCLQNRACISPRGLRARMALASSTQEPDTTDEGEEEATPLPPLKMRAEKFEIRGGTLTLQREGVSVPLEIVTIRGEQLSIPLETTTFTLHADILLHEANEPRPIRAKIVWNAPAQEFVISLLLRNVPLARFEELLPDITPKLQRMGSIGGALEKLGGAALSTNEAVTAATESPGMQSQTSGELTGEITIVYSENDQRWSMR